MRRPHHVLCTVDLSPASDEALRQADALARLYGAKLTVFHALPGLIPSAPLFPQHALARSTGLVALERRALDALATRVRGITRREPDQFSVDVATGSPHGAIVEAAERLDASLVVVGGGRPRKLLSGVAERVVRHAHCPVWVARPAPSADGPVLTATDFSDASLPAVAAAVAHARRSNAALQAVHALDVRRSMLPLGPAPEVPMLAVWAPEELEGLRKAGAESLRQVLERFDARGECIVSDRSPAAAILDQAQRSQARLICLGTTGRTGLKRFALGSVAEDVVRRAGCPVWVVRADPNLERSDPWQRRHSDSGTSRSEQAPSARRSPDRRGATSPSTRPGPA